MLHSYFNWYLIDTTFTIIQDDSNSMNPDISMPTSPLDQAGPSGVPGMQENKPTAGMFNVIQLSPRG